MLATMYKCRSCGKIFVGTQYKVKDDPYDILLYHEVRGSSIQMIKHITAGMTVAHDCAPGMKAGLADFIGIETFIDMETVE